MYKSPIDVTYNHRYEMDNAIYRCVIDVGIDVDKAELLRALKYDRGQYEKGYADALAKPDVVEVVRCKECMYSRELNRDNRYERQFIEGCVYCELQNVGHIGDAYCSSGRRKESE
jgi:hypothetical protein